MSRAFLLRSILRRSDLRKGDPCGQTISIASSSGGNDCRWGDPERADISPAAHRQFYEISTVTSAANFNLKDGDRQNDTLARYKIDPDRF